MNTKEQVRQRVWERMDTAGAGRTGSVQGKIPDFHGAPDAAQRLSEHERWRAAHVVKSNPDKAQAEVREAAIDAGKQVYMAVPRLASLQPFYSLDLALGVPGRVSATKAWAAEHAPRVTVPQMRPVDVVVCGSVAVNSAGIRLGKGAGYSDIEMGLLADAGLMGPETLIVTTVHDLQVLDEDLPEGPHDASVDLIVTPTRTITCPPRRRPQGIFAEALSTEQKTTIPALHPYLQAQ
ncbi:5-formyltetrahydrofolate cyclo-ligase [Nocardiopsis alborubida]|uniref:5-formyltetrahydrofolate cyclo-ligase n=1 Tax=Nocardiopsis alborubida TaxID=146802 RepID=A0A7X6M8L1_9ACTN|nr:5-formyltetrahydrofolate cyclo-ligase [Nocardiopsis alborubida]NKY96736.1 5-formyltetrahydrofolate cyclo-ligase [Nocardiopsis alborubida]